MKDFWLAGKIVPLLIGALILSPPLVSAFPVGGKVAAGKAAIGQPNGRTLNINQLTDKAIINWKGFSINVNELVKFTQPNAGSVVLNRVTGIEPSSILGRLVANGRVFIVNPNGVLFGANSVVDVAGLLATTLNIKDSDFMAGRFNFAQDPKKELSYVINNGQIKISDNGFVFLVAPGVANNGLIIANLGKVVMGAGEKFTVDFMGDGLITFALEGKVLDQVTGPDGHPLTSAVGNAGTIKADGGQVILTATASSEIFSSVVNQSGVIEAHSLVNRGGVVRLEGSDPVANTGKIGWQANLGKVKNAEGAVINTGTLDVSAAQPGAAPGEVTLSGQSIAVSGTILAKGADGARGGQVLITSRDKTVITGNSLIDTSGVGNSSAGNVVVWSDKDTIYRGGILAQGGKLGGDGGNAEVSGHENLLFAGNANTLAPNGTVGTLLLDPRNITVATAGAATTDQVDQFSDTPGTDQTIAPATIDAVASNVVLQANNNITVTNSIAMTTPGASLTMQAGRDININANVSTTNGAISLTANDSTAISANRSTGAGDIIMAAGTTLSSGSGNIALAIGPSATAPFSPGNITARTLTTTGGSILLDSPNAATLSGAVDAGSGTVTIAANKDGSGSQAFTMAAGSSITTTNATANAVQINVNAPGGGTGAAALRSITTGSGGTLTVATNTGGNVTGGDITQTAATLLNVGTGTLSLTTPAIASANIGSSGANIRTTAGTITASSGTSGVFITESDGADFTATATGAGAIRLTSATGPLAIAGPTSTGSGANTLTADTVDINAPLSSTGALTLLPVNAAGNLTVSSSAPNNLADGFSSITVGNASGTGAVTVNALTISDPLTIRSPTTTGTITVNGPITGLGNATVALTGGTGATPIILNAGISTTGRTITLSDNVGLGADVILDSTNGGASPTGATIRVTGTINADAAANNRALTLAGGTAGNITLGGTVGGTAPLGGFAATGNSITLPASITTSGNIALTSAGDLTINTLTSTAGGIDLTVTAGSIFDGNGAANNLTAAANSTLRGLGGVVGLIADPIEVSINPGTLGVAATGQVAGVSVNIDGTVLPSNTLVLLNSPPGLVLFNGRILSGSSSTVENLIRATSDLNPQRVNEFGPFTELLLHVLSDNYFEEKSGNCEMDEKLKKERKDSGC
jgi:filamentous hemagglutinin family protein